MKPLKEYDIQFVGLKLGKHHFDYQIDKKFFEHFEYDDFNDVDVTLNLLFEKKATLLELDFEVSGTVNVNCDTSNEPYNQEIEDDFNLVVKFGDEYNDENENILIIPHGEFELNVAQYIYELIILALPIKRIHPGIEDGTLKSEILEKLKELSPKDSEEKEETEEIDPRWNTLKQLLTDK
ncbi:YceD family protein [Gelidibacter maritimus]|uniref:DUF177 domain-containing protein n=1 Tax=Gelidibacter maritimus TaxID=2761487 RepID=A0A7W2M704_9FLAO|nr:DUF177 domain-containing protein [Gelidibacter maritimus]MBA6153907.1 DUF177 domain-containing protein [Gelidibacter maritimus]